MIGFAIRFYSRLYVKKPTQFIGRLGVLQRINE